MVAYQLIFPRTLDQSTLVAFFGSLHGIARAQWLLRDRPAVVLETEATAGRIRHRMVIPNGRHAEVEAALRATMADVRLEEDDLEELEFTEGIELTASSKHRALQMTDAVPTSATILASLQPLWKDETLRLQWVVAPAPTPAPARVAARRHSSGPPEVDLVREHREKQSEPLFMVTVRIAVSGCRGKRSRHLLGRVLSALRRVERPGVKLRVRWTSSLSATARRTQARAVPFLWWGMTLNAAELAGVVGVPLAGPSLQGVVVGTSRQLPLPPNASRNGVEVAQSTYPTDRRPICLPLTMRRQHALALGPTGSGKSNLMASMVLQDIDEGRGAIVLDPKADFAEDVLARIPEHRADDVIVLDPTDNGMPVGLNPLAVSRNDEAHRSLVVNNVVGTMHSLFSASWGVRTADVLRSTVATLVATRAADGTAWTLADIPAVLTDPRLRRHLAAQVDDPMVQSYWTQFESLSAAQQAEHIAPLMNKLRAILSDPRIRRILGQSKGLDLFDIIQQRKILIVPLPKGQLGGEAANLVGALVVAQLWSAVMARTVIPKDRRSVFMAYIDEASNFIHLPVAIGDMLAESRGLGLSVLLATQTLSQFPKELRDGVLTNARTKLLFALPHDDARTLTPFVEPALSTNDLKGLPAYEVAVHSDATDYTFTATGLTTELDPPPSDSSGIRQLSSGRWGTPAEDVDMAMARRQSLDVDVEDDPQGEPSAPATGRRIGARRRKRGESAA